MKLVAALGCFFKLPLGELLADAFGVKLYELQDTQLLWRAFVIERAGVSDFALQEPQISRVHWKLKAGIGRMRCRVDCAVGIVGTFIDEERTLELNLTAQSATIAFPSLVGFVTIENVVGQHIRQNVPTKRSPGV